MCNICNGYGNSYEPEREDIGEIDIKPGESLVNVDTGERSNAFAYDGSMLAVKDTNGFIHYVAIHGRVLPDSKWLPKWPNDE